MCDPSSDDGAAVGGARPKSKQNSGGGDGEGGETTESANPESSSLRRSSLGEVAPHWVPDSDAPACMRCELKFNLVKRRHHCRGCGKVLCHSCCNRRHALRYIDDGKPSRVCDDCKAALEVQEAEEAAAASPAKNPPPGVLKKNSVDQGSSAEGASGAAAASTPSENKQVMFSDGVRPGGDLTELDGSSSSPSRRSTSSRKKGSKSRSSRNVVIPHEDEAGAGRSLLPESRDELPALWGAPGKNSGEVAKALERGDTVAFIVNNNLLVRVKLLLYEPANKRMWNYCSAGLLSVGQDELVILISQDDGDALPSWHIFNHFQFLYEKAKDGPPVSQMGYSLLAPDSQLGRDNCYGGFLYVRASFQSLEGLAVPPEGVPRIFGLLITKWELPWARLFPLRLALRLGAEFRYYPAPLWSERGRQSVYNDIGNTMMKLLCDFRNYTYSLPIIHGLKIHMEKKLTKVLLPRNSYNSLHRALANSNQPVLALGAVLSKEADSHLVAMQRGDEDDGQQSQHLGISQSDYETQAINIANKDRVVTGASFIVFNGALKASTGLTAKSSIVEDGLMVQISQEKMVELRKAVEKLQDFQIDCGPVHADTPDETISIEWTDDVSDINEGVTSQVDLMKLEGVPSVRLHARRDFTSRGSSFFIRWTEVFFLAHSSDLEPSDHMTTAAGLAKAVSVTLSPFLEKLTRAGMSTVAIRVNLDVEKVSYDAGAGGKPLPSQMMKVLDDSLVPLIHYEAGNLKSCLELLFRILNC